MKSESRQEFSKNGPFRQNGGGGREACGFLEGWVFERQAATKCCPTWVWTTVPRWVPWKSHIGLQVLLVSSSMALMFMVRVGEEWAPWPRVLASPWGVSGDSRWSGLGLMGPFVRGSLEPK